MVQAIASARVASGLGPESSSAVLQAQLDRYQVQLADWCNCPSGKTPEGKRKIQEIQGKADAVKAQLDRMAAAKAARQAPISEQANAKPGSGAAGTGSTGVTAVGSLLDTFA